MINVTILIKSSLSSIQLTIMKASDLEREDKEEAYQHLKIIFAYYCKLNASKAKHKMFQDFNEKAVRMTLHEFMTFCKNFQITAKQHKRTDNNILSQFLQSKRQKEHIDQNGQNKKNDSHKNQKQATNYPLTKQENTSEEHHKKQGKVDQNQFFQPHEKDISNALLAQRPLKLPSAYLNEKKISEFFKRQCSQDGEINFETFITTLKHISEQMYEKLSNDVTQNQEKQEQNKIKNDDKQGIKGSGESMKNECFMDLLCFLNLDTKFHTIETFSKINQFHGNMQHLSLLRSPVKKLHLKNDPLGKYAKRDETNKQNASNSRLKLLDKTQKTQEKIQKLPRVAKPNLKKQLLSYAKNDLKPISKEQLSVFMLANKSQIEHLNKSYLKNVTGLISEENTNRDLGMDFLEGNSSKNYAIATQKKNKKYSQRHKDKVIGDIHHKQIGKLIDVSSLYDDDIFNKYVELNYRNQRK